MDNNNFDKEFCNHAAAVSGIHAVLQSPRQVGVACEITGTRKPDVSTEDSCSHSIFTPSVVDTLITAPCIRSVGRISLG